MPISKDSHVIEEIRTAYADAHEQRPDSAFSNDMRCLSFLSPTWLTAEDAAAAISHIGEYNAFDPEAVGALLSAIEEAAPHARFAIGREGSPAIYVQTGMTDTVMSAIEDHHVSPDECAVVAPDAVGPADPEEHIMCAHEQPPVPADEYATPDDGLGHVRMWWD